QINFSIMAPGTIFTMAGEQYRYLENMGANNHMIIRNEVITATTFHNKENRSNQWYSNLDPTVQAMVQPVSDNFVTGRIENAEAIWSAGGTRWVPTNLGAFPEVAADVTQVDPTGSPRAFVLSLADVTRLSGPGRAFPNPQERTVSNGTWWWFRTLGNTVGAFPDNLEGGWRDHEGALHGDLSMTHLSPNGGVRPALIINQ
ncbi:hypothetical protein AALA58_09945, partial [Lactococcus ileimucosae]